LDAACTLKSASSWGIEMERVKGLEPSASTLARSRSSQLSYTRIPKGVIVLHTLEVGVKLEFSSSAIGIFWEGFLGGLLDWMG
jgi:hypothetical protein